MRKWMATMVIAAAVILATVAIGLYRRDTNVRQPIAELVAARGTPTFLAKWLEVDEGKLRVLRVLVFPQDPATVTNWTSITNAIVVWADTEPGKRNARYFYDEMKNDRSFDGKGWYSSRSLFGGEKVVITRIDASGTVSDEKVIRVDAFAMQLMGFATPKSSAGEQER